MSAATISFMNTGTRTGTSSRPAAATSWSMIADLFGAALRVVRADLRPEPVLQRRHDAAAVRVVVGVRGRDQQEVERQPDPVAADLHVALLQDVEQRHLDALGEVGQLVDRDDAAVRARDHAVVDRELVGEVPALGHPDRVDVADQVGDGRVGRRELLARSGPRAGARRSVSASPSAATSARQRAQIGRNG